MTLAERTSRENRRRTGVPEVRDLAILLILAALLYGALYRPWVGVLGLTVIGCMNPHKYGSELIATLPAYQIMFVAVCLSVAWSFIFKRDEIRLPAFDWRLLLLVLLWAYFLFTTWHAIAAWAAWPRFYELTKTFVPLMLTLLLINSREKLFYLIITIATCFALLVLKGGYWAFMTGFSDRVYGPPGSHFYDNNYFAIAVIMTIPLLVLWLRETPDNRLRYILMVMIFLSAAAALSSWSRGALLSLGITTLFLVWHSRRKYLAIPVVLAGIFMSFQYLPQSWFERMQTIQAYETEESAGSRLETWKTGLDYAVQHPLTGAGFEGWRYVTYGTTGIDWHNAYIEILAEHGFVAFAIWLSLLLGSMISLSRLARLARQGPELTWIRNYSVMLQASLIAYAAGAIFLGLSYWDILYHLIIITVLLKQLAYRQAGFT